MLELKDLDEKGLSRCRRLPLRRRVSPSILSANCCLWPGGDVHSLTAHLCPSQKFYEYRSDEIFCPGGRLALPAPPGSYNPPPPQGYTDRPVSAGGYDRPPSASYERPTPGYEREARPPYNRSPPVGYDRQSGYEPRVPASPYGPPQFAPGGAQPVPGAYPRLQMAQPVPSSEPPRAASSGGPPQLSTSKMPIDQVRLLQL
jgi:hypothetical protein